MVEHVVTPTAVPASAALGPFAWFERHHFFWRRLHSLTGIIPVGVFLIEHIFTSSAILLGSDAYQKDIRFIWNLPGLELMEIFGIWVPIGFHAALGLVYTFTGRPNNYRYAYQDNWRYTLQRVTGVIAFVYIFLHLATVRWGWNIAGWHTKFVPDQATDTTVLALQQFGWLPWFFAIGVLAAVYHFANGLWTAAITWGLTVSVAAQRRWGYICAALGVALAAAGLGAVVTFARLPVNQAATAPTVAAAPAKAPVK